MGEARLRPFARTTTGGTHMEYDLKTRCIHGGLERSFEDPFRAISFPIYQTGSFGHRGAPTAEELGLTSAFTYSRQSNPTRQRLEETVSALEGAADTVAFSSGMAAVSLCFELFEPGDHIVCSEDLYGGVVRLFQEVSAKNGLAVTATDTSRIENIEPLITPRTRALYIETPSNPMMRVTDIAACARIARAHGLLLIVDNTFLSPYLQNPIALGADLVVHSGSKFLCGHNDVISGFLCAATAQMGERLRFMATTTGAVLDPFDSWLMLRGIKTLAVRMERQQANALALATWLQGHPRVAEVLYPGLPDHPGHALNAAQARGAGSMVSLRVDSEATARRLLDRLNLVIFAESLGGTETLITYPRYQTHADVPEADRERLGITDTLLRLSVGLEAVEDVIADFAQALEG